MAILLTWSIWLKVMLVWWQFLHVKNTYDITLLFDFSSNMKLSEYFEYFQYCKILSPSVNWVICKPLKVDYMSRAVACMQIWQELMVMSSCSPTNNCFNELPVLPRIKILTTVAFLCFLLYRFSNLSMKQLICFIFCLLCRYTLWFLPLASKGATCCCVPKLGSKWCDDTRSSQ